MVGVEDYKSNGVRDVPDPIRPNVDSDTNIHRPKMENSAWKLAALFSALGLWRYLGYSLLWLR